MSLEILIHQVWAGFIHLGLFRGRVASGDPMCSHVGEPLFQAPHFSEWETEAQGGDRICKLVVELGWKYVLPGSWLGARLLCGSCCLWHPERSPKAYSSAPGGKAQAFWLSQAQKCSGQRLDVGSFRVRGS